MVIDKWPLAAGWQDRLRFIKSYEFVGTPKERILAEARSAVLGETVLKPRPAWVIAADDASTQPPASEESHFTRGPFRVHAEFAVNGRQVHIDRIWAQMWGPGRIHKELHIFIDGVWSGFGRQLGVSYGVSVCIDPAIALLNDGTALIVRFAPSGRDQDSRSLCADPDSVEIVALT